MTSHFDYQEAPRDAVFTTAFEIEKLKKAKAEGKTIRVRLKLTGDYVPMIDDDWDKSYMYLIQGEKK